MAAQADARYLPIKLLHEVYELADHHLDAGFGLRLGRLMTSDDYGTLGLSWKTAWTASELLKRVERYMILVTDHGSIQIEESQGLTKLNIHRDPRRRGIGISNETSLAMLVQILKEVTATDIFPVRVQFKHTNQVTQPYLDYFQCEVLFGQSVNTIHFRTQEIDVPTLKADRSLHQFLVARMQEEADGIHLNADKILTDTRKLIEESLPSGIPNVIQIGAHMGMSARTLKRRLTEKGYTYRNFVQMIQEEIATELLKNAQQSIGEIAFQTGFSEQSAFHRAFKRWTGISPTEFRKNL